MSIFIVNHDSCYRDRDNRGAYDRSEDFVERVGYFETQEEAQTFVDGLWALYLAGKRREFDDLEGRRLRSHNARKAGIIKNQERWDALNAVNLAEGKRPADWRPGVPNVFDMILARRQCDDSFEITEIKKYKET